MNSIATGSPRLRPTAASLLDQALAEVGQGSATAAGVKPHLEAATQALDGYAGHTRAIEFDRPDKDVSSHGRALRGQADQAWGENEAARQDVGQIATHAERIQQNLTEALANCPTSKPKAKQYMQSAQAELQRLQERTLRDAQSTLRYAEKAVRTELSPYLTEVEEDGPGRDVGRFADDLNHWLSEARSGFGLGALESEWIARDLGDVKVRLEAARQNL